MASLHFFELRIFALGRFAKLHTDYLHKAATDYLHKAYVNKEALIINPLTPLIPVTSHSCKSDPIKFNLNINV